MALAGLRRAHRDGQEEQGGEEGDDGCSGEERAWTLLDPEGPYPAPARGAFVQRYRHRLQPYQQDPWNGRMTIRHACREVKPAHDTIGRRWQ